MTSAAARLLERAVRLEPGEAPAALAAAAYHFCLLCGYFVLRPIRDTMGIAGGVDQIPWLFLGTFLAMLAAVPLFGLLTARFRRSVFLPAVYLFFITNILAFAWAFERAPDQAVLARTFFIWVSVFNLFIVSVFWSFMVDLFSREQSRRIFGFLAAGGTAGALLGPLITGFLAEHIGQVVLMLVSATLLGLALVAIRYLLHWSQTSPASRLCPRSASAPVTETRAGGGAAHDRAARRGAGSVPVESALASLGHRSLETRFMALRIAALGGLVLLSACAGTPGAPDGAESAALGPLPTGGCYDGPLQIDVNGAVHALTRTGPQTFVVSGPVFSALEIDLSTNGETAYIRTNRGPRALDGDPATCRLSGEGALRSPTRGLPLAIAIAPAV